MKTGTALILGALTLTACDSVMPGGARYELLTASDSTLPMTLQVDEFRCVHRLYGGVVELDGKNGYRSSFDIRKTCGDSTARVAQRGAQGTFVVRNDTAFFTDGTGKPAGHGQLGRDTLIVRGPVHELIYVRR